MGEKNCMQLTPEEIMKRLQEPFAPEDIEWRVHRSMYVGDQVKAIVCAYVNNRAIQNRLDEVMGPFGWKNEFSTWRDKGVLCGISLKFGDEWVTKYDAADETNFESTKGGISASSKRTASAWGIGRYLYNVDEQWVNITQSRSTNEDIYFNAEVKKGNSKEYVKGYWSAPRLPDWALPSQYKHSEQKQPKDTNRGNNQPSGQQQPSKQDDMKQVLEHVGRIETVIGLSRQPGYIPRIFNKANPNHQINHPNELVNAPIDALYNYHNALKPVNDICVAAQHYGLPIEQVLNFAQIVKPDIEVKNILTLVFNVTKDEVQKIIHMAKAESQSKQRETA
ncbi:Rad52/Rad22 family DNA repair protein [Bacillus sp. AFS040349]|uniref:Rad52/Rad22 family DNA repair protein n=1 Tax=Bacillus sp. AFS040349 TaxID=2033502 RepID=UPI00159BD54C|nr:Rad52/Rad22 family DNA repair protein [Bacillus sp. AFS040349]